MSTRMDVLETVSSAGLRVDVALACLADEIAKALEACNIKVSEEVNRLQKLFDNEADTDSGSCAFRDINLSLWSSLQEGPDYPTNWRIILLKTYFVAKECGGVWPQ